MPHSVLSRELVPAPKQTAATASTEPSADALSVDSSHRPWVLAAALVLVAILWLLAWYGETVASIVQIWIRSETFAHGFLIVPISAWLIWRRRRAVTRLAATPSVIASVFLAASGFAWLLGELAEARVVQQFAVVMMIPLVVWAVLGIRVAWLLVFPLGYLVLAVPFGEFLEQPLMERTADFTVAALRLTGIPVYREGQQFMIPSGSWSVVEACSGLRYLIASFTLGVLYAYLMYRSALRRGMFVVLSVLVPIVANWLRAYLIVMIGHVSGMKYAAGIDHLIYGWIFFGVVMLILFWIGSFWREDESSPAQSAMRGEWQTFPLRGVLATTIAAAAIVAPWPLIASRIDAPEAFGDVVLQTPQSSRGDWHAVTNSLTEWTPHYDKPRVSVKQAYKRRADDVELYIGYYSNQRQGAQLVTSQNVLVRSNDRSWHNIGETRRVVSIDGVELPLIEARLRGGASQLLVWRWYWVDGRYVVNPYWAKLLQAKSKLLSGTDAAAVVMIYTPVGQSAHASEQVLREFAAGLLPEITRSVERARGP